VSEYVPGPGNWAEEQVAFDESNGGIQELTFRNTDFPVVSVTNHGWKTGLIRKIRLMRVTNGRHSIPLASNGVASNNPRWSDNLKADPNVEIQDETQDYTLRVREIIDSAYEGKRHFDPRMEQMIKIVNTEFNDKDL
jgi:F420H(2)-dependent quinone reductase